MTQIKQLMIATSDDWSPLVLRLALALMLFPHGVQKLFGWFGGYGYAGTMQYFTETVGLPGVVSFLVILVEFFAPLALLAGLATRFAAGAVTVLALGIVFTSHIQNGFFMNWSGVQAGEGVEFFLLWLGISVTLVLTGSGRYSVDRLFARA